MHGPRPGRPAARRCRYDTLVVAAGATHSYFGHDEFAEFAPGMKTIEDARYLRDRILSAFEMAETVDRPGGTGRVAHVRRDRGRARPASSWSGRSPSWPTRCCRATTAGRHHARRGSCCWRARRRCCRRSTRSCSATRSERLEKMGVEVRLNTLAVDMDRRQHHRQGPRRGGDDPRPAPGSGRRACRRRRWRRCSREKAGAEIDRAGRIPVQPDCTLPGIRRCSRSATWCRSTGCPAWRSPRCRRASTSAS